MAVDPISGLPQVAYQVNQKYPDGRANLRGSIVGVAKPLYFPRSRYYRRKNLLKDTKACMLRLAERKHLTTNAAGTFAAGGALASLSILS